MAFHNVTEGDVLGELGIDASQIKGESTRIDLGDITGYLRRAKGTIDSILVARGIAPDNLDPDNAQIMVEGAVLGYAVARSFRRLGRFKSAGTWWQDWKDGLDWARNQEGDLGNEIDTDVDSNVDLSDEQTWKFRDKEW